MGYTREQREAKKAEAAANTVGTAPIKAVKRQRPVIDATTEIYVINGFPGPLACTPPKSGFEYIFSAQGDGNYITFGELASIKSRYERFYKDNWLLIDDPDVLIALGVEKYYKTALTMEDFDKFFELSTSEIKKRVSGISKGQKQSLIYKCTELIDAGVIDSRKKIAELEDIFGVKFIED